MPRLRSSGRILYRGAFAMQLVLLPLLWSRGVLTPRGKGMVIGLFIGTILASLCGLGFSAARAPKSDEHLLMSGVWYYTVCQARMQSEAGFNLIAVVRPRGMPPAPLLTVRLSLPEGERLPPCFRFRKTIVPERTEHEFQA